MDTSKLFTAARVGWSVVGLLLLACTYIAAMIITAYGMEPRMSKVEPMALQVPDLVKRMAAVEAPIHAQFHTEPTLTARVRDIEQRNAGVDKLLDDRGRWMEDTSAKLSEAIGYLKAIAEQVGVRK